MVLTFVSALLIAGLWSARAADAPEGIEATLEKMNISADEIRATPVPGLYEIAIGASIVYLSEDGNYMVQGDVIDLRKRRNLTEGRRKGKRAEAVEQMADGMVVFSPEKIRHTVSVFTDVDCGYCATLHRQMDAYLGHGIQVRYLAYPRAGIPSANYDKMVSVWCADDQHQAMTDAKAGRTIKAATCANPVSEHYRLGGVVGVRGTPSIVLASGEVIPGYVPPDELAKMLDAGGVAAQRSR